MMLLYMYSVTLSWSDRKYIMYIGPWVFQYFLMWPPLKKVWTPLSYNVKQHKVMR